MKRIVLLSAYNVRCLTRWGCLLPLLAAACTIPQPTATLLTEEAGNTPAIARPTYTSAFVPTRTPAPPTPTLSEVEQQARRLLEASANRMFDCETSFPGCGGTFLLRVLEFLHAHPSTPYRTALIEHVVDTSVGAYRQLQYEWLVDEWIDQALVQPFQAAGGLPAGFAESWPRGKIMPADLDNDRAPDYLVTVNALPHTDALASIRLYWLFSRDGQWQQEQLVRTVSEHGLELLSTRDVNADGQADLAYTLTHCGASDCFAYLRLLTRQEGSWQRIPVLARYGNDEAAHTNGWKFTTGPDGSTMLMMAQGGSSSPQYAPSLAYNVHFAWLGEAFIPVSISPLENSLYLSSLKIQWADRLAASQRFAEAIPVLAEALTDKSQLKLSRYDPPFILFRLGMAHLYLQQPAEARAAWAQLVQEYPDMAISRDVSRLRALIDQPQPAWKVCDWYLRQRPNWWQPELGHPVYYHPFDLSTWCDPWLLVTLPTWERGQPLEQQAAHLGLDWQLLSDAYDLNGDGSNDPIALLEGEAWAFLTSGEHYQPLFAESELPLGAIQEPFHGSPDYPNKRTLQIADLDRNSKPEIWILEDIRVMVWLWQSSRFQGQWQQFHLQDKGYWGKARLEDGMVRVRIAEFPYSEERVIGEFTYQLVNGKLQRTNPPLQRTSSADTLSAALEALYHQDEPQQALHVLENFTPQAPERDWSADPFEPDLYLDLQWEYAAACALRALAHEHLGDKSAAAQEWLILQQKYPHPAWLGLAFDLGKLVQPPN
ncbi:MAG: tetratricopeptide repeat protein [Chloroflexota bacterium]